MPDYTIGLWASAHPVRGSGQMTATDDSSPTAKPDPARGRGLRWKLPLLGLSVLVALGVAELVVRLARLAPAVYSVDIEAQDSAFVLSDNPLLAYEMRPNHRNTRTDGHNINVSTNSHGQRDVERTLEKPEGTTRLLLLGDSVVQGITLADLEQTISRRVERMFADPPIEVLNFGVVGYNTRAEVELLRVKGLRFDPDTVVLLFVPNDYMDYNFASTRYGFRFKRNALADRAFKSSALFRLVAMRFDLLGYRTETDPEYRKTVHRQSIGGNPVEDGLRELARLSGERGFDVLIAIWPVFGHETISHLGYLADVENPAGLHVESIARGLGLDTVRLSRHFERDYFERLNAAKSGGGSPGSPLELYTSGDGMHPNGLGTEVASLALFEILQSR
jgi:hypothetical protein